MEWSCKVPEYLTKSHPNFVSWEVISSARQGGYSRGLTLDWVGKKDMLAHGGGLPNDI